MTVFSQSVQVPVSPQTAFAWHERPGAFLRLRPPWEPVELLEHTGGIRDGARVRLRIALVGTLRMHAVFGHCDYLEGERFVDEQISGPFSEYRHEHLFKALKDGAACELRDHIRYRAPFGGGSIVARKLKKMFAYRHRIFAADMEDIAQRGPCQPQTVLVTGVSGMIGAALCARLQTRGHTVRTLSRSPNKDDPAAFGWSPSKGELDPAALDGVGAVIHLAGAPIAQRWTPERRREIMASRTASTSLLVSHLKTRPEQKVTFICSSGINYYGYDVAGPVDEHTGSGDGFLAEVCRAWEAAAAPLEGLGHRVVSVRTGVVLSPEGGMLGKLLPLFRAGLGGPIGRGQRMLSWISIEDIVEVFLRALEDAVYAGPINAVAPAPVSNQVFTRELARVLRRPAVCPAPPCALKAAFGPMGEETILSNLKVQPTVLQARGFTFRQADLATALADLLNPHPAPEQ